MTSGVSGADSTAWEGISTGGAGPTTGSVSKTGLDDWLDGEQVFQDKVALSFSAAKHKQEQQKLATMVVG